jgi:hypothetical protein
MTAFIHNLIARTMAFSRNSLFLAVCALVASVAVMGVMSSKAALASGDVNEASCPNESMVGFNANLPDCRAYEQVSPVEKDGGSGGVLNFDYPNQVFLVTGGFGGRPMQTLSDGSKITYAGEPFFDVQRKEAGEVLFGQYTSSRSASGWETQTADTLPLETAPVPVLPSAAETSVQFVEDAQVVEETPSGSKVFFLDAAELPGISTAGPSEPDLYEYTEPTPALPQGRMIDLTVDPTPGQHADVQGIIGIGGEGAEEGAYVYFVAGGIVAPGPSKSGCKSSNQETVGEGCNLYLRHNGITTYITTLPSEDEHGFSNQQVGGVVGFERTLDWAPLPFERTSEVSPNGRYIVLGSHAALTVAVNGSVEIYRYDATASEKHEQPLVCVSCSTIGAAAAPEAILPSSPRTLINGANRQRSVLDDGRVFFTTTAALVPQDVNNQADVYEWEDGVPRLISGGTSDISYAVFTDASADGSDVFFTTSQSLVSQDQDEITDLYDAKEYGGFPPRLAPACPVDAACSAAARRSEPPTLPGTPASATFSGMESLPPPLTTGPPSTPKPLTKREELTKALRSCHAKRDRRKRSACEKLARKRYGPARRSASKKRGKL